MATRSDGPQSGRAARARRLVGKVAARGARRLDASPTRVGREEGAATGAALAPVEAPGRIVAEAHETFFRSLERDGDVAVAATSLVRAQLDASLVRRARTFAQVLQRGEGRLAQIGDLCMAMVTAATRMFDESWRLFSAADLREVLQLAAPEYLGLAFTVDRDSAVKTLDAVAAGELDARADARGWLNVAGAAFAARAEPQSQYALRRARGELEAVPGDQLKPVRAAADWLAKWYGRAAAAPEPLPTGTVPIAVMSYRHPDRAAATRNLGHYLESLAVVAQLARRTDVRVSGDPDLVALVEQVRASVAANRQIPGKPASAHLVPVDRDAAGCASAPDGTWLLVTGLLPRPLFGVTTQLPFPDGIRPVFVSVHVDSAEALTPAVLDHLRRYGPVGCRDWATTLLLLAADVPAYFAGPVAATLDAIAGLPTAANADADADADADAQLFVDVAPDRAGERASQVSDQVRNQAPARNLRRAVEWVTDLRRRKRVVTSRLQTYLAARAVGTEVRFLPDNPAERRFDGLTGLDDGAFAVMQQRLHDRLADLLGLILSGAAEDDVYAQWRALCAADVAEAEARRADVPELPRSAFNIARACTTIHAASTTIERSEPGPPGPEINVELSLDGNYKHQLEVVLDSIVEHASRPVRAFVLCRDHTQQDYERLAALFPTVSFVWLPTDGVDYGPISGLLGYTTVATMDRLLLPDLLPNLDRIVHHDLDALCLADLAELYDVELGDEPLAGRETPQAGLSSGFAAFMKQAERFKQSPELGRELLRRTHGRHRFDFKALNAGIMVLNLERMRADGFGRHFVPFVERFGMNDQSVLNVYAGGTRVDVASGWNWRPWLEVEDDPKIAHWAGKYKPWSEPWVIGKELWQEAERRLAVRYERSKVLRHSSGEVNRSTSER